MTRLALQQCIEDATTEVNGTSRTGITRPNLVNSAWVEMRCRISRLPKLCELRLNDVPATAQRCYERALDMLAPPRRATRNLPDCPREKGWQWPCRTSARGLGRGALGRGAVAVHWDGGRLRPQVDPTDFPIPGSEDAAKKGQVRRPLARTSHAKYAAGKPQKQAVASPTTKVGNLGGGTKKVSGQAIFRGSKADLRRALHALPAILSGRAPTRTVSHAVCILRMANAFRFASPTGVRSKRLVVAPA